jgi:hypothetical protein
VLWFQTRFSFLFPVHELTFNVTAHIHLTFWFTVPCHFRALGCEVFHNFIILVKNLIIGTPHLIYYGDKLKEDEADGICKMYERRIFFGLKS